jgi:hypothetical protein
MEDAYNVPSDPALLLSFRRSSYICTRNLFCDGNCGKLGNPANSGKEAECKTALRPYLYPARWLLRESIGGSVWREGLDSI